LRVSKLQRDSRGKLILKANKVKRYGESGSCCCCSCEACDAENLEDGIWPQYLSGVMSGLGVCSLTNCTFAGGDDAYKFTSFTPSGTDGNVNTTYRLCLDHTFDDGGIPTAMYHCKVPASLRLPFQQYAADCVTPKTSNLSLIIAADVRYTTSQSGGWVSLSATASRAANVVTVTTTGTHGLTVNQCVVHTGFTSAGATDFNGTFLVTGTPSGTTYTVAQTAANDTATGGTITGPHLMEVNSQMSLLREGQSVFATGAEIDYATGVLLWFRAAGSINFSSTPTFRTLTQNPAFTACGTNMASGTLSLTPCTLL
jgi:hypothetical protein